MAQRVEMSLMLGPELWDTPLHRCLQEKGHSLSKLPDGVDAYISFNAWRIPPGTALDEVEKHLTSILKQVKATAHVQAKAEAAAQERASKKPRKPAKRKPRAQTEGSSTGEVHRPEDKPDTTSDSSTTPTTG